MSPDRFLNGLLLTGGALIVGLCGLCTVVMVGWSLPAIFSRTSDAVYGQMVLVGALLVGGMSVFVGGALFHYARAGPRKPDDLDLLASGLTVVGGGFYVLVFTGLTAMAAGALWDQVTDPPEHLGSDVAFSLFWALAFAVAASACAWLAYGGLRRYREARTSLAEARGTR